MSFEKRQNWLTRNQGRIALTVACAAVSVWGCQVVVPTANNGENSVALKPGQNGTVGQTGTKPGNAATNPGQTGTATNPDGTASNPGQTGTETPVTQGPVDPTTVKPAEPGTEAAPGQPTLPMNALVANPTPTNWTNKAIIVSDAVRAAFPKSANAADNVVTIVGRIVDETGKAAANVPVVTSQFKTTTNAEGWYEIKSEAAPDVALSFGGNDAGYVPFDDFVAIYPGETYRYDTQILSLDDNKTTINIADGGVATSSSLTKVLGELSVTRPSATNPKQAFGLFQIPQMTGDLKAVYLEIPPGALIMPNGETSTEVTLTWLNPLPRPDKPYGDLYGPLQTYTAWDAATKSGTKGDKVNPFDPVNFADLDLGGATIAPGKDVKVKWVVGPEVLTKYPITMQAGQAFMPCYQYDKGEGWTKPVLATVFEDQGYTWTSYTMRGSNPPAVYEAD